MKDWTMAFIVAAFENVKIEIIPTILKYYKYYILINHSV